MKIQSLRDLPFTGLDKIEAQRASIFITTGETCGYEAIIIYQPQRG